MQSNHEQDKKGKATIAICIDQTSIQTATNAGIWAVNLS